MVLRRAFLDELICRWWIPVGLALFIGGLFWAPSPHNYKVATPYLLLLPALLSALLNPSAWSRFIRLPAIQCMLLYLVYLVSVSIALNGDKGFEFGKWALYSVCFVFAIGARMTISERNFALLLLGGAIIAAITGIIATYRDISSGFFWQPLYRLKGLATLNNELRAGFLFGAFTLFACWCLQSDLLLRWQRLLGGVVAVIGLAATLLTGSRAPLLALAAAGVVITASEKRWTQLALVVAASTIILALFWDRLSERGLSLRPEIWRYVWQQCLEHPWFGIGLSRAPIDVPTSMGLKYNTHNIFLAVLYQGGIVGLLLYLAMVVTTFWQSWSLRNITAYGTLAALLQIYAIVALQFDGVGLLMRPDDSWILLWLPIALYWYARRVAADKAQAIGASPPCAAS